MRFIITPAGLTAFFLGVYTLALIIALVFIIANFMVLGIFITPWFMVTIFWCPLFYLAFAEI